MKRVIVIVQGGLGNQLFGVCSALLWQKQFGIKVVFDTSTGFFLDKYKRSLVVDEVIDFTKLNVTYAPWVALPFRYAGKVARRVPSLLRFARPAVTDSELDELIEWFRTPGSSFRVLDGYWQSRVDAAEARATMHPLWRGRSGSDLAGQEWRAAIRPSQEVVGVHLRLKYNYCSAGNFVRDLPAPPAEYYRRAVQCANQALDHPLFVVCSDGELSDDELRKLGMESFVNLTVRPRKETDDMNTLRCCRSHILSASTFSWWATVLKTEEGGVTICPRFAKYGQLMTQQTDWLEVSAGDDEPARSVYEVG